MKAKDQLGGEEREVGMEKSWKYRATVEITTEELCHFFTVRSPGFAGTLAAGEFPAALESFAPIPCQILAGNIPVVRHERDVGWGGTSTRSTNSQSTRRAAC